MLKSKFYTKLFTEFGKMDKSDKTLLIEILQNMKNYPVINKFEWENKINIWKNKKKETK